MPSSRLLSSFLRCSAVVACALSAFAAGGAAATPDPARVIVRYRDGGSLAAGGLRAHRQLQHAAVLSQRLGLRLDDGRPIGSHMQVVQGDGLSADELAARLAADPDIEFAVPSRRQRAHATLPNDPLYPAGQTTVTPAAGQWYLRAPAAPVVSSIDAVGAWAVTTGSANVVVAVLDTGVRFDHPDLVASFIPATTSCRAPPPPTTATAATPTPAIRATGSPPANAVPAARRSRAVGTAPGSPG